MVPLFEELFPFGGQLEEDNRWQRIAQLIPWRRLEAEYNAHFSRLGRPETDSRLFLGLILLKHLTGLSDREVLQSIRENVYQQAFCGFEEFVTGAVLEPSTLTKLRKWLGTGFFKRMEEETHQVLIERKIIRAKGMLGDAKVFPENVKYPNDVGLLNDVREWLVRNFKTLGRELERPYRHQRQMYRERKNRIDGRIVSFHREYVRPIMRGKGGSKDTEFGPKGALSYVDGFLFLDELRHDNFSEAAGKIVETQLEAYRQKFGKLSSTFTGDCLYGTRENRRLMKERGVRPSFKPLGRPKEDGAPLKQMSHPFLFFVDPASLTK